MLRLLTTASALTAATLFGAATPATAQVPLTTELYLTGVSSPVDMKAAPGDSTRLFVVEQGGRIRVVVNDVLMATPFLNIDPIVASGGERGLLGLAFHPDYANNGRFFVNYTNNGGNTVIQEYAVSADPNVAQPTAVQTIATINQDFSNHNGGCVQFGPDGKLYVGMGDGGSGNDPNNRAQSTNQRLGKMLRYDVDLSAPFIPTDNPFVGNSAYDPAIWHLGLRNPWRFSFDRDTGDMWIGDVGQSAQEEVDFVPAGVGGLNFGWKCKEGTNCATSGSGCNCNNPAFVDPIQTYPTGTGCSISGGYVYRGSAIPSLQGTYFYADFCNSRITSLMYDGTTVSNIVNRTNELDPPTGPNISSISAFAEDSDGEMYILSLNGRIWKIIADAPPCAATQYCTAVVNQSGNAANTNATGSFSIADNNLLLVSGGIQQGTFGLYFYGDSQIQQPLGYGNLCVGGELHRIPVILQADFFGSVSHLFDLTSIVATTGNGAITPGSTWNFQFWFRDILNGQQGYNFSNGVSVLFCP